MSGETVTGLKVVLAGNPNSGKSTIFNYLTGAKQRISNFPGVTVERYEGKLQSEGVKINLIDLPGLYSLDSKNDEEKVAGEHLRDEPCDVIVNVVDASSLERHLYLTFQLKELGRPMLVVLNMCDVARRRGIEIDVETLSEALGVPVLETIGRKAVGLREVIAEITRLGVEGRHLPRPVPVPAESQPRFETPHGKRGEEGCLSRACAGCSKTCARIVAHDIARFKEIDAVCSRAVRNVLPMERTFSDRVDAVLTNRYFGIPIFLLAMYLVFQLTFTIGQYPMDWTEAGIGYLSEYFSGLWPEGSESFLKSLVVDGIIGGVGGVIVFLPNIVLLFLGISFLEDSGYLARAAVLSDRSMSRLGLPGRSIVPLLVGFGCTVPALMATRMLTSRKERLITMLVLPLFSCGARFPIYALLIPAFFPVQWRGPILWLIYLIGIFLALVTAKVLSLLFPKGEETSFIIELPPYHLPTFRTVGMKTCERAWEYLKKAGTVILGASILLWFLTSYPKASPEVCDEIHARRMSIVAAGEELKNLLGTLDGQESRAEPNADTVEARRAALFLAGSAVRDQIDSLDNGSGLQSKDSGPSRDELIRTDAMLKKISAGLDGDEVRLELQAEEIEMRRTALTLAGDALESKLETLDYEESQADLQASFSGRIGRGLEPILRPMGFDWKIGTALVGAVAAKEAFIAQMGIVYSLGNAEENEQGIAEVLRANYTGLTGFCVMIFSLIATPCIATLVVMARESGSWKWAAIQWFGLTLMAWVVTTLVYQVGSSFF